jgi:hypothetical protein
MNLNFSNRATALSRCLQRATLALFIMLGIVACAGQPAPDANQEMTMKLSITYLHLLRHTPFFTALTTEQLRWVIEHSQEWETEARSVIARVDQPDASPTDYWILLDGQWQVHYDGNTFPSGHAAAGKWFNVREAQGADCTLITTEHSYVMRITEADMTTMLKQGFAFDHHLKDGRIYYGSMFHSNAQASGSSAH